MKLKERRSKSHRSNLIKKPENLGNVRNVGADVINYEENRTLPIE